MTEEELTAAEALLAKLGKRLIACREQTHEMRMRVERAVEAKVTNQELAVAMLESVEIGLTTAEEMLEGIAWLLPKDTVH